MAISICVPLWRRKQLFLKVLESIHRQGIQVEVSVFQDIYSEEERITRSELKDKYPDLIFTIATGDEDKKIPMTPCEAQNRAVSQSHGDLVIIQAADIYHPEENLKEVLEWASSAPDGWCAVAPCIHLDQEATQEYLAGKSLNYETIQDCLEISKSYDNPVPKIRWSVHPEYFPVPVPTFFAVPRGTLEKTGVYDMAYASGSSWADIDLMMKFQGKVHWLKNPVIHLWHPESWTSPEMVKLGMKNQRIFERRWNLPASELPDFWKKSFTK